MISEKEHQAIVANFERICYHNTILFAKKNKEYGNSIESTGVLGAVIAIMGCVARFPILLLQNSTRGRNVKAVLVNVLMDIHNYANIALMMIAMENWEGK